MQRRPCSLGSPFNETERRAVRADQDVLPDRSYDARTVPVPDLGRRTQRGEHPDPEQDDRRELTVIPSREGDVGCVPVRCR